MEHARADRLHRFDQSSSHQSRLTRHFRGRASILSTATCLTLHLMGSSVAGEIRRNSERRHRLGYRGRAFESGARKGTGASKRWFRPRRRCGWDLIALNAAFDVLSAQLGRADRHVITMTGELCDAFPSRREGVAGLAAIAADHLSPCSPEPLRWPGRVRRAWRSRFPCRRHRLGQLARKRRAPRAQASGRAVHRHRLNDNGHHSRSSQARSRRSATATRSGSLRAS